MAGDIGKFLLAGLGSIALWSSLSQETKDGISTLVNGALTGLDSKNKEVQGGEAEPQQRLALPQPVSPYILESVERIEPSEPVADPNPPWLQTGFVQHERWLDLVPHPSIVVILGKRGSGKSALGYCLLEQFRTQKEPYVIGLPQPALKHLPDWIGVADSLDEVPPGACVLIDEAYLRYHARDSQSKVSKEMSRQLNLSRQRDQTLIFITQESRQVDKNVISVANVIVFKEPSALQAEFERPEVRKIAESAVKEFSQVDGDRRKWSYVFAPESDYRGMVENKTATFWSAALSRAFAGSKSAAPARARSGTKTPIEERRAKVRYLRDLKWSLSKIAREVGVSKGTVINDLKGAA